LPRREPAELAARLARKADADVMRQTRIHDLDRLAESLEQGGVELPLPRNRLDELTVFAVPLRYEDLLDAEPLDRDAIVALVNEVGAWATGKLAPPEG